MKLRTLFLVTLITLIACTTNKKTGSLNSNTIEFSVYDSLNKYSVVDSILIPFKVIRTGWTLDTSATRILDKDGNPPDVMFCDTIDAQFYMGLANNTHFGFTLIESKITFYQKINNNWIITDSSDFFEPIKLEKMDLNGDSYNDLRITTVYDKENGDLLTCVFIYDNQNSYFKLNPSFGQANVEFDKKDHFVKFWIGCKKGQRGVKWRGILVGNNILEVDSTITFHLMTDEKNGSKIGTLELYKGPNGASYKPIYSVTGNPDSLWTIFSLTFWNSN